MRSKPVKSFFVTGTDTGIGKTLVTRFLIRSLQRKGYQVVGCKPIACGLNDKGQQEDALIYQAVNSYELPPDILNPICLKLPVSPNIAATLENMAINIDAIAIKLKSLDQLPIDFAFLEGVGGWKVPINDRDTMEDLVLTLAIPVIFVVGIRVGCLNHAILTWEAIDRSRLKMAGWIANVIEPQTPAIDQHVNTLKNTIKGPYLGMLPYHFSDDHSLNLQPLAESHVDKI